MDCTSDKNNTMVANLQFRRKALESKILEKNQELKQLCIQEAELTGYLPPEIPLFPGETPPKFRRRVGTSFTYPENLINKLKYKEEETLASLELEYKIQKGIAEAALGLANDETANKSVRRKHRQMYQQSQQHLNELETRIHLNSNQKLKKKARPESCISDFQNNVSDVVTNYEPKSQPLNQKILPPKTNLRLSQSYHKFHIPKTSDDPRYEIPLCNGRSSNSNSQLLKSTTSLDKEQVPYPKNNSVFVNNSISINFPSSHEMTNKIIQNDFNFKYNIDRFGSLDKRHTRNSNSQKNIDREASIPAHYVNSQQTQNSSTAVLLPNQMYPENSLLRTHSLGNVKNTNTALPDVEKILISDNKKNSEKQWIETSLDSFENIVEPQIPFETPKSHTVVQIGKWQPYREITKPFEMSDFYKYSTRFRKPPTNSSNTTPELVQTISNPTTSQNKGIYQPLKAINCQPLAHQNISLMEDTVCPIDSFESKKELLLEDSMFANEMLSWYQDETTPQSKTATLV